jgi:magnesium transporter
MIHIAEDALKPTISIFSYNEDEVITSKGDDMGVILEQFKKCDNHTHWISRLTAWAI